MASETNIEYYQRRASEAQQMADASTDTRVSAVHRELAANYLELARMDADQPVKLRRAG